MDLASPISLPTLDLPEALRLPAPVLEIPEADLPKYEPLVVPPSDLRAPPGVEGQTGNEKAPVTPPPSVAPPAEVRQVDIPMTDLTVPVPTPEILMTAGTTAVVSVAATLTATSVFKHLVTIFKPILKQGWSRLTKKSQAEDPKSSSSSS